MPDTQTRDGDTEALKQDLAALREAVESLANDLGKLREHATGAARERIDATVDHLRERLDALGGEAARRGRNTVDTMERTVAERPLQSVLIAFGLGALAGHLLSRR